MTENGSAFGAALYELALSEKISQQILEELSMVCGILKENPKYLKLLSSRALTVQERLGGLKVAFSNGVHPYLMNVLSILTEKAVPQEIFECATQYRKRYNADNDIVDVTATSAVGLTAEQKQRLTEKLENMLHKKVLLSTKTDPVVLGSVKLELPGVQLDGTVKNKLENIRARLLKEV